MPPQKQNFDLFLSYNSRDHEQVEDLARRLRQHRLTLFFDRWYLAPGLRWRPTLEDTLTSCRAVVVCVGPNGMGTWQQREIDVALDRQSRDAQFPVIPLLLPGSEAPLGFLRQLMWVDLRNQPLEQGVLVLAKAIRGEPLGEELQQQIDATRAAICPYRGLLYFREEDAPFFFGRDAAIGQLVEAVRQKSFLAVVGASGSGKSSVVRAGLVPQLRRDRDTVWEVATFLPGEQPLRSLAAALVPFLEPDMTEIDRLAEVGKLSAYFAAGTVSLGDVIRRLLAKQAGTDRVLLVVDQCEELYTLTQDDALRRRFVDELLNATACAPTTVVLTLRGDFVGKALAYRLLSDRLQGAQINLGPMTRAELEQAVTQPAHYKGLSFEPGLAERILDDAGDEPGNLPLLEFVLKELWEARQGPLLQNQTYDEMDRLSGAIAKRAERFFGALTPPEQEAVRRLLLQLVHPGEGNNDTRRREPLVNIPDTSRQLVKKLADERLIVTAKAEEVLEETAEVAHEALIRNWGRFRGWLDTDREFLLWRERLRGLLGEWQRASKSEELLLRGPLLSEAERWVTGCADRLTAQEKEFISLSAKASERHRQEEQARRQKELDQVLALAEDQKKLAEEAARREMAEKERADAATKLAHERASRNKILVAGALAVLTVLATGAVTSTFFAVGQTRARKEAERQRVWAVNARNTAESERTKAEQEKTRAEEAERKAETEKARALKAEKAAREELYPSQIRLADAHRLQNSFGSVRRILESCPVLLRGWEWQRLESLSHQASLTLSGHAEVVKCVAWSPDGKRLASVGNDFVLAVWDAVSGQCVGRFRGFHGSPDSVVFSRDNSHLLTASFDAITRIWDINTGQVLKSFDSGHNNGTLKACYSPDGTSVVSANVDNLRVWNVKTGTETLTIPCKEAWDIDISPDGKRIASASIGDNNIRIWDAHSGGALKVLEGHQAAIRSVAYSPDGASIASGSEDTSVRLWNAESGASSELGKHEGAVLAVRFSRDGNYIASAGRDNIIKVWNTSDRTLFCILQGHGDEVTSLAFDPDGKRIVSGSGDKTIRVWELRAGGIDRTLQFTQGTGVGSVALCPDAGHLMSTDGKTGTISFLNIKTSLIDEQFKYPSVWEAAYSLDGRYFAAASYDNTFKVWELRAKRLLCRIDQVQSQVSLLALSPDGKKILSCNPNRRNVVYDVDTCEPLFSLTWEKMGFDCAVFSRDGSAIVTSDWDGTIFVWNAENGQMVRTLKGHDDRIQALVFSPDGERLVSACSDRTARIWDWKRGTEVEVSPLVGHGGGVRCAAYAPDGSRIVTGGEDRNIKLWSSETGHELLTLRGHEASVICVGFTSDGNRLVSASGDGVVRLWGSVRTEVGEVPAASVAAQERESAAANEPDQELRWLVEQTKEKLLKAVGYGALVYRVRSSDGNMGSARVEFHWTGKGRGGYSPGTVVEGGLKVVLEVAGQPAELRLIHPAYHEFRRPVVFERGKVIVWDDILMERVSPENACAISGRVQLEDAADANGIRVTSGEGGAEAITDPQGGFLLAGLRSGEVSIRAQKAGYEGLYAAVHVLRGETASCELRGFRTRKVRVRWAYQPNGTREFTGDNVITGVAVLQDGLLDRLSFGKGFKNVNGESDFLIYQRAAVLLITNVDVRGDTGPGFVEVDNTSFDELTEAPASGYARPTKTLRPGVVYVFRCFDGRHYAKMAVLEILD